MLAATSGLREVEREEAAPAAAGARPEKDFFAPPEALPVDDFAYLVGNGAVTIRYGTDLPRGEWEQIESFVHSSEDTAAGPVRDPASAVVAVAQSRVLTCDSVDIEALVGFREIWSREWEETRRP